MKLLITLLAGFGFVYFFPDGEQGRLVMCSLMACIAILAS